MAGSAIVRALTNTLSFGAGSAAGSQVALRIRARQQPFPFPHQMASILDHPLRVRYHNPGETLGLYGITAGMTVLDLGCGTGLYTEELGRMVGPTGTVHGVDIQEQMVEATRARLMAAGLNDRSVLHHAGAYTLPIEDASVDVALMVATLGEIPDRLHALLEIFRVIKPGGRLAVSEELLHMAWLLPGEVRSVAEEAGFSFAGKTGSPLHYHMVFVRP